MELFSCMTYDKEPKFCEVRHLAKYPRRTQAFRKTNNLFLTCRKQYKAATKDHLSRWCKLLLKDSGINIDNYNSHSFRIVRFVHLYLWLYELQVNTKSILENICKVLKVELQDYY